MKTRGIVSRSVTLLLAIVMVLTMVPWMQLGVFAAEHDLSMDPHYNYTSFDFTDTIKLPIKIYDYSSDGILFEYLSGVGGGYIKQAKNEETGAIEPVQEKWT